MLSLWPSQFLALLLSTVTQLPVSMAPAAAQQQPTFRSGVDVVQLNVVVLDRNRRPFSGLTERDFTVEVDGRRVEVVAFSHVRLPETTRTSVEAVGSVSRVAAEGRPLAVLDGRLVTILLDRSISAGAAVEHARRIARAALDALGPADLASVIRNSPFANDGIEQATFTVDRQLLGRAIDSAFQGATPDPPLAPGEKPLPSGGCACGLCSLDAVERAADAMKPFEGRQKILLFIGSSISIHERSPEIMRYGGFCGDLVGVPRDRAMKALDRANVTMHVVDPRGLVTLAPLADPRAEKISRQEEMARQSDLAVFPSFTGGRTVVSTNTPEARIPEIFAETQSYYSLAFERPSAIETRGRRSVRVRVRGDRLTVITRSGYYASQP